ncbi:MAG: GAF domain-containing protein [Planctomycetota bacterium]|nr:GAF domain-containing protein [Planctomycetota bacterium]
MSAPSSRSSAPSNSSSRRLLPIPASASLAEKTQVQAQEIEKLHLLLDTVRDLGTELSLDLLMGLIVERASKMMNCERSTVFLVDRARNELYSLVAQGLDSREIRVPMNAGLIGEVARSGAKLNVPDAYADPRFNPEVDRRTGFRTRSVLAMPLHDRRGDLLGVIQCLNNRNRRGDFVPFEASDETFLSALAGLAEVFLENAKLYRDMDHLFESIVTAVSLAIDSRDPCTSGHSRRVTQYSLNLARAVHQCSRPPFEQVTYTRERFRQLRFAGLLHDVGKIGVREYILCKADKLPPGGASLIRARLELMLAKRKIEVYEHALAEKADPAARLAAEYEPLAQEIHGAIELVEAKNKCGFVSDEDLAALKGLLERGWITETEHINLSVRKGNLTEAEWVDMRSHVTKSYEMLIRIPWPKELAELPEVAYTHHEKRDGSGYPRRLKGDEIHFDGQVMCVADIYDALTSSDRPYKKAMPHEVAKKILTEEEAAKFRILPELVALFFEQECYKIVPDHPFPPSGAYPTAKE